MDIFPKCIGTIIPCPICLCNVSLVYMMSYDSRLSVMDNKILKDIIEWQMETKVAAGSRDGR